MIAVSKVEKEKFWLTGIVIERTDEGIRMSMEDYDKSMKEIKDIEDGDKSEALTKIKIKCTEYMSER